VTSNDEGVIRGLFFKSVVATTGLLLAAFLLWALRSLIVPVAVSGLLAYVCRPVVASLERYRVPRSVAIGLLLLTFVVSALFVVDRIRAIIPTEIGAIEFKVRALYTINERYRDLMQLDSTLANGNRLYQFVHADVDPLVDRVNQLLALAPQERSALLASHSGGANNQAPSDSLLDEDRVNLQTLGVRARTARVEERVAGSPRLTAAQALTAPVNKPLAVLAQILSTWIVAPLVFLFLLTDTGEIKRGLLSLVPNRLFEPALTVLADVDHALGDWVRGLFLECSLLAITVAVLLAIIGIPLRWSIAIGLFAGATNVVPYLGTAVALLGGLAYALFALEIHPLLPVVTAENLAIWVIVVVGLAELIKNVVYEPVVLGGAVKLHPLVVVIGAMGGAILFGLAGVLLAIPTICVFKVLVSSAARQLKAYGLI
jgi:predicted PurR-regulated permease PerM